MLAYTGTVLHAIVVLPATLGDKRKCLGELSQPGSMYLFSPAPYGAAPWLYDCGS